LSYYGTNISYVSPLTYYKPIVTYSVYNIFKAEQGVIQFNFRKIPHTPASKIFDGFGFRFF